MGLSRWYKRWRHSRGYGIHSPFAYRMVREVLCPPRGYAYYAESQLRHAELRLLFRILVALRPATVAVFAGAQQAALEHLVSLALPSAVIHDGAADMLIVHGLAEVPSGAADARVIYLNDSRHPLLRTCTLPHGHIYRNPMRALIVRRQGLPAQTFDIRF